MDINIEKSWGEALKNIFEEDYFLNLVKFVKQEYKEKIIYPKAGNIFRAFDLCPVEKVSVVIVGQDPYHGENQANGLAFSVNVGEKLPPSLKNIYKELELDLGKKFSDRDGDLERWAEQGVFLINSVLTVRAQQAGSHANYGWEKFTDGVIDFLNRKKKNIVYILWGNYAKKKCDIIAKTRNLVLCSSHPSPLSASRGFFHNNFFSKTNDYLREHDKQEIHW
ncbi:MAG: uracil-DNA glycosylase [Cytophagales bacterium]|nr:uracil-DNA glycosylase [Cytophagales bacterium]